MTQTSIKINDFMEVASLSSLINISSVSEAILVDNPRHVTLKQNYSGANV